MIGLARDLDGPSAFTSPLDGAVGRLTWLAHRLLGAVQTRLSRDRPPPQAGGIAGAPVIPTVRYRDVSAAIEWLCCAFGMQVHRVVADAGGTPCYAELTIGSGMLIVAPIEDTPFGKLMVQPDEIGGVETQVCYLCVGNARTHYARAKAAGAAIVLDLEDEANQGRGYSCRDPEGHVWNFGTYDPWVGPRQHAGSHADSWSWRRLQHGLAAVVLLMLAGALVGHAIPQPSARAGTAVAGITPDAQASLTLTPVALDERPPEAADPAVKGPAAKDPAMHEAALPGVAIEAAERSAERARRELAEARSALERAREEAEREVTAARSQLDELQRAREAAERAAAEAREHLAAAQKAAERARSQAALERTRRIAAIRTVMRARRARSVYSASPRARTWCYNPSFPAPASSRYARLAGFCRG
jgi:uncharacterized glyoxalase superfamily protein PhnB